MPHGVADDVIQQLPEPTVLLHTYRRFRDDTKVTIPLSDNVTCQSPKRQRCISIIVPRRQSNCNRLMSPG